MFRIYDRGANLLDKAEFYIKIPLFSLVIITITVYLTIYISCMLPMRKMNKISPIEAINNVKEIKITEKTLKTPKIIAKVFGEEGKIAYKNIKRDKSKYKTIVISLTTSIILFLSCNGFISIYYNCVDFFSMKTSTAGLPMSQMTLYNGGGEKVNNVIEYLKENNLMDDYEIYEIGEWYSMKLERSQFSNQINEMIEDGIVKLGEDEKFSLDVGTIYYHDKAYKNILNKLNIEELKDNEVIIENYEEVGPKYGGRVPVTNFKVGDTYELAINGTYKTFKIVGIIDEMLDKKDDSKKQYESVLPSVGLVQIVNHNTFQEINNLEDKNSLYPETYPDLYIDVYGDNTMETEKHRTRLEEICGRK